MFNICGKRGQLTVFIIIAIVIVAAVAFIIYIQRSQNMPRSEIQVIKNYLDSCFKEKARDTITETARQGFYHDLPLASINFLGEKTAYYFKDSQNIAPTITTIEQELSNAMDERMLPCLALSDFREQYEITRQECSSTAKIKDKSITFSIKCPITITRNMVTSKLENFEISVPSNAEKLINVSNLVVNEYASKPKYLCLKCLDNIAQANNVTINAVVITKAVFEPEHIWFIIQDKEKLNEQNLTLRFVTDYK